MDAGLLGGIAAVAAVAIIALIMRSSRPSETQMPPVPRTPAPPSYEPSYGADDNEDDDEDGPDAGHVVAVTSDGHALIPDKRVVRLLPPEDSGEEWKVGAGIRPATLRAEQAFGSTWSSGDMSGARVVKGGAEEGAWVLQTLGRDGEFYPFDFETREAAEAAKHLFESQGVVKLGEDEDGHPMPPSSEQFEEAHRVYRQTMAELGTDDGEEPR